MRLFLLVLLAVVAIGAVTWFDYDDHSARSLDAPEVVDSTAKESSELDVPDVEREQERAVLADAVVEASDASVAVIDEPIHFKGRVVYEDQRPATGIEIKVRAYLGFRVTHTAPGWTDREASTNADGSFDIEFVPPTDANFFLSISPQRHVAVMWRRSEQELAGGLDIGTHVLEAAGTVRVRVVDGERRDAPGAWIATVFHPTEPRPDGRVNVVPDAAVDAATGYALIERVPLGLMGVRAATKNTPWLPEQEVEVLRDEIVDVEFVYVGPNPARQITLSTHFRPHELMQLDRSRVQLIGPGFEVRSLAECEGNAFIDLPGGLYRVTIDDPQFLPWSQDGIELGTYVRAKLTPSATMRLTVLAANQAVPLESYSVEVRFDDSMRYPNQYALLAEGKPIPENSEFAVPPQSLTLLVSANGYGTAEIPLVDLQPNEVRDVTAHLVRTVKLAGRVVMADGVTPVPQAIVHLHAPGTEPTPQQPGFVMSSTRKMAQPIQMLHAEDDGYFEMQVEPGSYALHGKLNEFIVGRVDPLVVPEGGLGDWVIVKLPGLGSLTGRLTGGDMRQVEGLFVDIAEVGSVPNSLFLEDKHLTRVDAGGEFHIDDLQPGTHDIYLLAPRIDVAVQPKFKIQTKPAQILIGQVQIEAGADKSMEFLCGDDWPGRFDIRVNTNDADGYVLQLECELRGAGESSVELAQDGTATLRGLLPGEYRASLRSIDGSWEVAIGDFDVAPGQVVEVTHDLELFASTVQFIDADSGEPLAKIQLVVDRSLGQGVIGTTDADGRIELELPPGDFTISTWNVEPTRSATLTWTAAGPIADRFEMRLPASEK